MAAPPDDAPPSYDAATASSSTTRPAATSQTLSPHHIRNGIPPQDRRSMEDEGRPLPSGWLRQYDPANHHQFFVDTNKDPPRSIWHHPYDDDEYLNSLDAKERKRVQSLHKIPSEADVLAMSSDEEGDHYPSTHHPPAGHPASSTAQQPSGGASRFGRKLKDKLTSTTHEQREAQRRQRAIEEQQAYERHQHIRQVMSRAMETGQPQLLGKDRDGKDLYIEPPQGSGMPLRGGYGYNPYTQGPYAAPNARFIRPSYPYGRPYGGGYGGGYGLPLMGGMMGGLLMGDMMFGGFGGGGF